MREYGSGVQVSILHVCSQIILSIFFSGCTIYILDVLGNYNFLCDYLLEAKKELRIQHRPLHHLSVGGSVVETTGIVFELEEISSCV